MSTQKQFDPEDLPLYAMQLLPPDETASLQLHLVQSPATRQEVAEIQGVLAAVAFTSEMHSPAPGARARFLKAVAAEKHLRQEIQQPAPRLVATPAEAPAKAAELPLNAPVEVPSLGGYYRGEAPASNVLSFEPEAARRGLASRVLPWVGWALAAGLALTTGNLYQRSEGLKRSFASDEAQLARTTADAATAHNVMDAMTDQAAMRVTLTRQGALLSPTGRTVYSAEKGILLFSATNMEPIQTFKVYELWLIPVGGGKPIPAGTFRPDAKGAASMVLTTMPKGVDAKAFGITIEEDGGAKNPTPPILMTGA